MGILAFVGCPWLGLKPYTMENIVHRLKCQNPYFCDVVSGAKSFEARIDDREPKFARDHYVVLQEVNQLGLITGREYSGRIAYVLRGERFGILSGHAVLGLSPCVLPSKFEESVPANI
jgi:hypothetical protein